MTKFVCMWNNKMDTLQSIMKGGHYEVKIENVYDPSKFWVIVKFKELAIFMRYLKCFYDSAENRKSILKSNLKTNLMCIVRRSDIYYRSVILPLLLSDKNQVKVFMIDFGYIVSVYLDNVFYICEKHQDVPRFAVRASLAYISPTDQSKTWSLTDLKTFCEIIENGRIFAKVCEIDIERKILFTEIYTPSRITHKSVNDVLVDLNLARYNKRNMNDNVELIRYKSKVKYPHLFPSFERLEGGIVPSSLWESDLLKNCVPLDLLYKDYYEYLSRD